MDASKNKPLMTNNVPIPLAKKDSHHVTFKAEIKKQKSVYNINTVILLVSVICSTGYSHSKNNNKLHIYKIYVNRSGAFIVGFFIRHSPQPYDVSTLFQSIHSQRHPGIAAV